MFVAGKPINVTREGKLVQLSIGDPVPEAETWPIDVLARIKRQGQVVETSNPKAVVKAAEARLSKRLPKTIQAQKLAKGKPQGTHDANVAAGIADLKQKKGKSTHDVTVARAKAAKKQKAKQSGDSPLAL